MILVTGATGLLGSRLLFDLVSKGFPVRALRRETSRMTCINHYFSNRPDLAERIDWIIGDVTDIFSLEKALDGVSQIYHCAARVSFLPSDRDLMQHINIEGTANVVNACLARGIHKLAFVSSIAAIGRSEDEGMIDETASWKSSKLNSSYAISKYGAEREVWRGVAEGLDAVIVNPGVIIGPGNWKTDSSMLFRQVAKGLKFYTGGVTGFVDVRDVSWVLIALMESSIVNERFVLVSENKPFREVMDRIADITGKKRPSIYAGPLLSDFAWRMEYLKWKLTGSKPIITRETARSAGGKHYYSSNKIKRMLDWKFIPVEKAIDDAAAYFLNKHLADNNQHDVSAMAV